MTKLRPLLIFLFSFLTFQMGTAQTEYYGLKKAQIKKLSTVELKNGLKSFPESYLYGMHGDSLILLTDVSSWVQPTFFAKSKISIAGYTELIISSRADRRKKSLIWGTILGAVSYAVVQKASSQKSYERTVSQILIGQPSNSGQIEGIIAGVTGFGIGMIIGQTLSKRKMNLKKQKRAALKTLKEFSY